MQTTFNVSVGEWSATH